ncbi:MAG: NAD(P)/FAD-dependent oxidoreductase [Planctomycetaceae bacterium]
MNPQRPTHRVVIVGGGFGGLNLARRLARSPVDVVLIDRRNFHLFQPLLFQVATGALSPANIAAPLRSILRGQRNTAVRQGEVADIDVARREVVLREGARVLYDTLVVASGVRHSYFGNDQWEPNAPGLKSIEDATEIRRRVLSAFEAAEQESSPENRAACLTFIIVGGGPTGVEMAGALAELSRHTLEQEFRTIKTSEARILLVEGLDRVLPTYPPSLSQKALKSLERLGVSVQLRTKIIDVDAGGATIETDSQREHIAARTVIWAAGVQASPLGRAIAEKTKTELDRNGRLVVNSDLTVPGHPEIFVIGDLACFRQADGRPLPGVAPVAIQQGRFVARAIARRLRGQPVGSFRYRDMGNLATIGRSAAVADFGWLRFSGFLAWFLWLVIHLMNLIMFQNRLLVLIQWAWNYFTYNRSARLITGPTESFPPPAPAPSPNDPQTRSSA